jgi:hypothetical protein
MGLRPHFLCADGRYTYPTKCHRRATEKQQATDLKRQLQKSHDKIIGIVIFLQKTKIGACRK